MVAYWWVNQNQTWRAEIEGHYIWSPKKNKNNGRNQFYDNLRLVEAGDLIFSYFKQHIQKVGVAQRAAVSAPKPPEFGVAGKNWSEDGWLVPVQWHDLENPYRPIEIFSQLKPVLPSTYSPLNRETGAGLQNVYLASVPHQMAEVLLSPLGDVGKHAIDGFSADVGNDEAIRKIDDAIQAQIENNTALNKTERKALVSARIGQGRFRSNTIAVEGKCRLTGVSDLRLLRASHIKPWRSCASGEERLDGNNGLLLSPAADHLFDQGYISFENSGELLISSKVRLDQLLRLGLPGSDFVAIPFGASRHHYLEHHRINSFRGI